MTNELKAFIKANGLKIKDEKPVANGNQIILDNDIKIIEYNNSHNVLIQGREPEKTEVEKIFSSYERSKKMDNTKIFVVYGHDETAKTQLEVFLRRLNLEPIMLNSLPSEGRTIIEKLEHYTNKCSYAIVLATPDDLGYPVGKEDEKHYRARQNVVLELGMLLSILGRERVAILIKNQVKMERPSDIQGLIYIPFENNIEDAKISLCKELQANGYNVDIQNM